MKLQKKINKKFHPIYFFKKNSELINEIFGKTKLSLQHYFYLRIVKPKRNSLISPINFHRETFYNEPFFKFAYNPTIDHHSSSQYSLFIVLDNTCGP